ncbi:glycosyltransferase family 2 protein [Amycolatopsis pretoriensis]|uniref:glycosyltransferase family 2 protein n=1 Tax=Amycolatopsis pretoriensis TaxID=218821 RepID=UPI00142E3172|nr:hypothetical protein [Amycolatopsis pretoriensis]
MINLLMFDASTRGRVLEGGYIAVRCARSSDLVDARNHAVKTFLERPADWLFFVDTDMGFAPDTIDRLIEVADPKTRPIVGGLCFAQKETAQDGLSGYRTAPRVTILDWVDTDGGPTFMGRTRYPVNSVIKCAGTGAACILIHRSVLERIRDENGPVWFDRVPGGGGKLLGEDVSFCVRAGALDIPVHVHTGVRTTHLKSAWLGEADFWDAATAPPATEPTAVVVPVMRRPQNAEPFMATLRATTGLATVYAVADVADTETADAWRHAGAQVIDYDGDTPGTFSEKMNTGYRETTEPWIFLTGDDVAFRPGWLDHAQATAGDDLHVIGTNDLGNPAVIAGEHATHILIRRAYVDETGASWDGPKVLAHEGYRHWFVDNEIVTAARRRGVWGMALASVVEHLHPRWGKADTDDVYALGESRAIPDRHLFERRARKHVQ